MLLKRYLPFLDILPLLSWKLKICLVILSCIRMFNVTNLLKSILNLIRKSRLLLVRKDQFMRSLEKERAMLWLSILSMAVPSWTQTLQLAAFSQSGRQILTNLSEIPSELKWMPSSLSLVLEQQPYTITQLKIKFRSWLLLMIIGSFLMITALLSLKQKSSVQETSGQPVITSNIEKLSLNGLHKERLWGILED